MNYKKSKQTNQSQKRYKLENNLIIFKDYFVRRISEIKCFNFIKLIIK
jgi:hypothetical protein